MTETVDPRYRDLDDWTSLQALSAIWESQLAAVAAVGPALPAIARAVDGAAERLREGQGRLAYVGAGTSARVAVQDGSELPPTFGWPEARLLFLTAGGEGALSQAVEGAEDDREDAERQVRAASLGPSDVLIGLAASGRTPFTLSALSAARAAGALTVGMADNLDAPIFRDCDHPILVETGSEVLAGSTRMKAGTAQKVVLNMISTQVMVRLGRVHGGLMVDMRPANEKLRRRAEEMVTQISGVSSDAAQSALDAARWDIKRAVLIAGGMEPDEAARRLAAAGGHLRRAMGEAR